MLSSADNDSFSDLVSVYLKVFDPLTWNFEYFGGIQQVLNSDFLKFRILEILNFHPWAQVSLCRLIRVFAACIHKYG